jgi:hypothetical protein
MASDTEAPESVSTTPSDGAIANAHAQLRELLVPGEVLQATSQQRRLFALTHRRTIVAATTNRFIGMTRGLIGGFTPIDVRWQDVQDVDLRVGIFGATLTIHSNAPADLAIAGQTSGTLVYHGLGKSAAQAVYRICQAQEQAWREKRRVRELEELRAKSGGIQMGASAMGAALSEPRTGDAVQRLAQAKEMLDKGLINDSEYESMKARIIGAM